MDVMQLRRSLLLSGHLNEYTATGNPLKFNTNKAKPLKSLTIPWTPTQTGSGDPSPENVRSISGVSSLTVSHSGQDTSDPTTYPIVFPALGKNLFDVSSYPFTVGKRISGDDGTLGSNSDFEATVDFIPCADIAGETVTLNKRPGGNLPGIGFYSSASEDACISAIRNSNATADTAWTFEIPSNAKYMRFTIHKASTDIQIEKGSSATSYEPYTNTVYGGSLDVVSGVLTVTHKLFSANTSTMNNSENYPGWKNTGIKANGAKGGTFTNAFVNVGKSYSVNVNDANDIIYLSKDYYSNKTQTEWIALELDVQIAYELATAQTVQLSTTEITALLGDNTIWSDTNGTNTAVYLKRG